MLQTKIDNSFAIYEVPEEERDKHRGFRFIVNMNFELWKKIESQLKD